MLGRWRFLKLFRRARRFEDRLSALQSSLERSELQPGGTASSLARAVPQHQPADARAELLIGLNDDLDRARKGVRRGRSALAFIAIAGSFALFGTPQLPLDVLGLPIVIALGVGLLELRR